MMVTGSAPRAENEVARTEIRKVPWTMERTTPKATALFGTTRFINPCATIL